MSAAHTPSPWLWSGDELIGSNGKRVIETIPYEGMWIDPECDDARLIAAAPDLLSALIILLHYDEQDAACVPTSAHLDAQDAARAAIAKATGQ